jgi:hypothetical protein
MGNGNLSDESISTWFPDDWEELRVKRAATLRERGLTAVVSAEEPTDQEPAAQNTTPPTVMA